VADGGRLTASKVDRQYVQGRTAAGGWSQQRFARRRDNQARAAAADGVDLVVRLLLPRYVG
jgi:peptide subunit release factor 1 (eRF1)